MRTIRRITAICAIAVVAACVPKPEPDRAPPPRPQPPVTQPAPALPPPPARPWEDQPLTPGTWVYGSDAGGSQASYGVTGSEAPFVLRCDRAARRLALLREGRAASAAMIVRTSYGARTLPASQQSQPRQVVRADLNASDPLLDQIAFSRGRFAIEAQGLPQLVLPAWAEIGRVVEDCRL